MTSTHDGPSLTEIDMKTLLIKGVNLIKACKAAVVLRREQRRDRDAFMALVWQEDRVLSDVGYTRADINWAVNLPIHMNAALELDKCVRGAQANKESPVQSEQPRRLPLRAAVKDFRPGGFCRYFAVKQDLSIRPLTDISQNQSSKSASRTDDGLFPQTTSQVGSVEECNT